MNAKALKIPIINVVIKAIGLLVMYVSVIYPDKIIQAVKIIIEIISLYRILKLKTFRAIINCSIAVIN